MKNAGLFSTIFIDSVQEHITSSDEAQGRLVTLSQSWQRRDASGASPLWNSFIKAALGNLGFIIQDLTGVQAGRGAHALYEDYSYQNCLAMLYLVEPGADLDDQSVGRFWPAKLITALRDKKLNWGILTDGATWRLYSTKSAKPFEDHVELDLAAALEAQDETAYSTFERFFHADCFVPVERDDYEKEKAKQFKILGLKVKRQKRADAGIEEEDGEIAETDEEKERKAGIYLSRLDLDGELSEGVLEAWVKIPLLAQVDGVLRYVCNGFIADTPRTGDAYTEEERRELFESSVKLLYRCLFLFYAEARQLLPSEARHAELYAPHSIRALCEEARKFRWNERNDTGGYDLWQHLKGLVQAVNEGDPGYGIMGYNGGLFDDEEERFLGKHRIRNDYLASALYWLAYVDPDSAESSKEYPIPYADLEVRHLGEMYEAILEYKVLLADVDYLRRRTKKGTQTIQATGNIPQKDDVRIKAGDIFFGETAHERKQTGSYYTPESLVRFLVKEAVIEPLWKRWKNNYQSRFNEYLKQTKVGYDDGARRGAVRSAEELVTQFVQREVLTYKACDPAMGSGHFLVATANLMADFIVELLAGIEPLQSVSTSETGAPNYWRRLITRHCLYGADLNPLAVNLAKLALWLNCFARDHKLTFLDHHLRCGNTLVGLQNLSDFSSVPHSRKKARNNREPEESEQINFDKKLFRNQLHEAAKAIAAIPNLAEDDTTTQREAFENAREKIQLGFAPLADLYAAFIMDPDLQPADYTKLLEWFATDDSPESPPGKLGAIWHYVCNLRRRHKFFHWPLEFPDVFAGENNQGFNAIIGNPPWERTALEELEFFARSCAEVMTAPTTAIRKKVIQELSETQPRLFEEYTSEKQKVDFEARFFKESGLYPLGARGRLNTYALFANLGLNILCEKGCSGLVLQSGLASDAPMEDFWKFLVKERRLITFIDFENKNRIFQDVHPEQKFALVSFAGCSREIDAPISVGFWLRKIEELHDKNKVYDLDTKDLSTFSPNTGQPLMTRQSSDVELLRKIYSKSDIFWNARSRKGMAKAWVAMTSASFSDKLYSESDLVDAVPHGEWELTLDEVTYLPLIEAKLIEQYNICFATYENVSNEALAAGDPHEIFHSNGSLLKLPKPRFWAKNSVVNEFIKTKNGSNSWCIGYRDVTNVNNERTAIATILPAVGFLQPLNGIFCPNAETAAVVIASFNSIVCDFVARLRFTGRHLNVTTFAQLPVPKVTDISYIVPRVIELVYTGNCLRSFALDCGYDGSPYPWNIDRRFQLRCQLDAAFGHFYGLSKNDLRYIFSTFGVLMSRDRKEFGSFRTRDTVLEYFDKFYEEVKHA